ncbi:MAG: S-layer homology domain-containing protein, partial [Firmicutes bacterium]|nr:S-layer homology domain-containing protein [Bacillota bacterium]
SAGSNQGGATVNVPLSFSDIPPGHWAYDAIMEMVSINMFKGMTEPDANGVALFGESDPMTYVQFLAVMTRLLYPSVDEDYSFAAEEGWFMPYYYAALDFGLIEYNEVAVADLNKPMTREQMARVLVRSGILFGTVTGETGYTDFPDVDKVGDEYFEAVAIAYGEGLLCGVDAAGTFNPQGTLTRAQAAMVCYRLLDSSTRVLP